MKRWILLVGVCFIATKGYSQNFAVKSNILYDATTTINLGVEFALSDKWTLDLSGNYNPWKFPQKVVDAKGNEDADKAHDAKLQHFMIQPELRYWLCDKFNGHYFGVHAHYAKYNVGGLSFLPDGFADGYVVENGKQGNREGEYTDDSKQFFHVYDGIQHKRFDGWLAGAGVSYGYHWILADRFSLDFTLGLGYAYLNYGKYNCQDCSQKEASKYMNYFGPTKLAVSAVFMLK
jgi:long-subunit fatty acid transport protein